MKSLTVREEVSRRGWSKTFDAPVIYYGTVPVQYNRDNNLLRAGRRQIGAFNFINAVNRSTGTLGIYPDFVTERGIIVPPGTIITRDNITYQEFELRCLTGAFITAGEVTITFGYEPGLLREEGFPSGARRRGF